ncbi:MAG: histidine phosphatase family protein [Zetaproteobacteria bacterium]|nr:MAG: histidine phosphatase family protein [Zetaproteobacteria bacterium]
MTDPILVDLLRHGAVEAEGWSLHGATDTPLSRRGFRQMEAVCRRLAPHDEIASSPMARCRSFAEERARTTGVRCTLLEGMREIDFGIWEQHTLEEIERDHGALLRRFRTSPVGVTPPGGEPFDRFADRVLSTWERWMGEATGGRRRLLVAHGGVIRVILAHLLQMPRSALWRIHLPHAAASRVSLLAGEAPRILFINGPPAGVEADCAG